MVKGRDARARCPPARLRLRYSRRLISPCQDSTHQLQKDHGKPALPCAGLGVPKPSQTTETGTEDLPMQPKEP